MYCTAHNIMHDPNPSLQASNPKTTTLKGRFWFSYLWFYLELEITIYNECNRIFCFFRYVRTRDEQSSKVHP
jgi:hypothetical protein